MQRGSRVIDSPPAVTDPTGGGGGWAWLLTARGIIEAELVRGVLESAGIVPVALDGRDPSPGAWMFLSGNVNALVRVFVPVSLLDSAKLVLLETGFDETGLDSPEPVTAPAPPEERRRTIPARWVLLAITVVMVAIFIFAT